jgi:hypothetical protein
MTNIDRKERFINENYENEGTKKNIRRAFEKIADIEELYNTDLDNFNKEQVIEALGALDSKTVESLCKELSYIKKYKKWSAAEGYSVFDAASIAIYKSDLGRYINKTAHDNQYIKSRAEFYEILKKVYNVQDQIIPVLLYEGICGRPIQEHNFEEIRNLKATDCFYEQNTIIVRDDDGHVRILNDIDKRSMDIIFAAINSTEYHRNNGTMEGEYAIKPLEESQNVVKKVSKQNNIEEMTVGFIGSKIVAFKRYTELYWINAKKIMYSGMFDRLQSIEANGNELQVEDYREVCKRYLMNEKRWNVIRDKYLAFKAIKT